METNEERIAVAETRIQNLEEKQNEILNLQRTMLDQLARYKGFFGGVVFVISALWFVLDMGKELIKFKFGLR